MVGTFASLHGGTRRYFLSCLTSIYRSRCRFSHISSSQKNPHQTYHAERPLFSLSEKKITIRHSFFTNASASSSSAYSIISSRLAKCSRQRIVLPLPIAPLNPEVYLLFECVPPQLPLGVVPVHQGILQSSSLRTALISPR